MLTGNNNNDRQYKIFAWVRSVWNQSNPIEISWLELVQEIYARISDDRQAEVHLVPSVSHIF
jgi:hypothetical protein